MTIHQIEKLAQNKGYDSLEFIAVGGKLSNPINCKWLDAYLGMFMVQGIKGFILTNQADEQLGIFTCIPLEGKTDYKEWGQ